MTILTGALVVALGLFRQQGPLTLEEALKIGEANAYGVRLADTAIEKAKQRALEAIGALGPKLDVNATYTRFDKEISSDFGGTPTVTRPIDSKDAKLMLTMPLDITGRTGRAVRSGARLNVKAAEATRQATINDLHQSIKKAFFAVLQAQAVLAVTAESRERALQRLKNVQAEQAAGTRAKVDVVRLETALTQADTDLLAAQGNLALAKNILNNTLGRPIETPVEVAEAPVWTPTTMTEEELVAVANASRPDLVALRHLAAIQKSAREVEERGGSPSFNLSANHSRTFGQKAFGAASSSTTGVLSVSMPIWDSGITKARVRAARQDEQTAKLQLEQATLGVSLEVRQAMVNLRNADARVKVADQQVKLAEESYRLTSIKFDAGEGIPLEVADASTQLTQARTQLVNAKYDYLRAIADLERAIGKDLKPEGSR